MKNSLINLEMGNSCTKSTELCVSSAEKKIIDRNAKEERKKQAVLDDFIRKRTRDWTNPDDSQLYFRLKQAKLDQLKLSNRR
jgi:regulator of extracellular matrix RemA (YlzA/DUF370 family)